MINKTNKWINGAIPALLLHLCVGSVYAFSLYINKIVEYMNVSSSAAQFTFSLAIFFLGMSAAFCGRMVENNITKSAFVGTTFFVLGNILGGIGVITKQIWLLYLGYGIIGGIGLGVTYLTPCKTLMLHFKENKGFAMGLSVMGFGFASAIASPIVTKLFGLYSVGQVMIIMGLLYLLPMIIGSILLKKPKVDMVESDSKAIKFNYLDIIKNPIFILCWVIFFINIHCGLSLIGIASPFMQAYNLSAIAIATTVSVMGIFNGSGRIVFSTIGDKFTNRSNIYKLIILLSLLAIINCFIKINVISIAMLLFVVSSCYGGGFSNIAPLLSDIFDMNNISKIHGAILTAWGIAGLTGNMMSTLIFNFTHNYLYVLLEVGILYIIGLICSCILEQIISRR